MRVALSGLTMAEYFRDTEHRTFFSSSITSSVSFRPAARSPLCLAVCPPPVGYQPTGKRNGLTPGGASPPRSPVPSPRFRRSTSRRTTLPTPPRRRPSPTLTLPPFSAVRYPSRASARGRSLSPPPRVSLGADIVGEEHYTIARRVQGDAAEVSGAAGYHRHPRYGRAE